MKHLGSWLLPFAAITVLAAPPPAAAVINQLRGSVIDPEGNPVPDVEVTLEYKGEKQGSKNTFKVKTDSKGGWIRIGIPDGPYTIKFSKEGYRTKGIEFYLSMGALSEIPDMVIAPLPPGEQAVDPAKLEEEEARRKAEAEEAAKLGKLYQGAMDAITLKDWDTAETLLRQVLEGAPDNPLVHFNLAFVAVQRNDPAKNDLQTAEQAYRKVIELEPFNSEAHVALAIVLQETGRREEGVDLLQGATDGFGDDVTFQTALGAMAMNANRNDVAEAAFKKVIELDPTNAEVHYHLASLAINAGNIKEGIAHLEQVVALSPPDAATTADAKDLIEALKSAE